MAAAQFANLGALRAGVVARLLLRKLVDTSLRMMPAASLRLAAYVQMRNRELNAGNSAATFETLLAKSDVSLRHIDVLNLLKAAGCLPEESLHQYLTAALNARRIDLIDSVLENKLHLKTDTRLFHDLRLQQFRGDIRFNGKEIFDAFVRLRRNSRYRKEATNIAADLLVRGNQTGLVEKLFGTLSASEIANLNPATLLGCVRFFSGNNLAERAANLSKSYVDGLPPEKQLYYLEILTESHAKSVAGGSLEWRPILKRMAALYSAADAVDRGNFERLVVGPFNRIKADSSDFMNIRFDIPKRQALFARIANALKTEQPLALVRLGDGEAYGYPSTPIDGLEDKVFDEDNEIRERCWWAKPPQASKREEIKARFRKSIADSDIIGLPSVYRIIRERGAVGSRFVQHGATQRGLATVLSRLGLDIPLENKILTEERCHQLLFDRNGIKQLCAAARKIVVVSCWTRQQLSLAAQAPVYEIVIPGSLKVAKATGMTADTPTLLETFDRQVEELEQQCSPGCLVLVGAGLLGKIFIASARAKGAVALDVGAALDYFAGHKTRSLADFG